MRRRTLHRATILIGILLAVLSSAVLLPPQSAAHSGTEETLPGIGVEERLGTRIPLDLTFRDETGRTVRLGDLVTGPTIILPVYYTCSNICNYLQGGMASSLPKVQRKPVTEYRVLSVSIDETETPELAARFKRIYMTAMTPPFPPEGWHFLTGDARDIRLLTDAAGYRFQRKGHEFVHPVASFVVAGDGTIVRYLYGTTFLPKDLTMALLEAQTGKAGATIRTVVGYCFSFDPTAKTYVFNLLRVSATVIVICVGSFVAFLLVTGRKKRNLPEKP